MVKKKKMKKTEDLRKLPFGSKPLEEFPKSKYIPKGSKFALPSKRGRLG